MADVELVIKIPEELYEAYKGRPPMLGDTGMDMIAQSIANGIPLPNGHGKLIDADEFDSRIRAAGGMSEEDLTEDFKDGVLTVLGILKKHRAVVEAETSK